MATEDKSPKGAVKENNGTSSATKANSSPSKASGEKPGAMKPVTVFHQITASMGKADFFLAPDAACWIAHNGDNIAIAKAPNWDIVLYSKSQNLGYSITAAKLGGDHMGLFKSPLALNAGKVDPFQGQRFGYRGWQSILDGSRNPVVEKDVFIFQAAEKPRVVRDVTLICADVGKLEFGCQRFMNWIYDEMKVPGMPLEMVTRFTDGSKIDIYKTTSVEKTTKPDSFFTYPTGFKKSPVKINVLTSVDTRSTLEDLFGSVPGK